MKQTKILVSAVFLPICITLLSGCSLDAGNVGSNIDAVRESVKDYISGGRNNVEETADSRTNVENVNSAFDAAEEINVSDQTVEQVNGLVKKTLEETFAGSKLVSVQNEGKTPFIMKYAVEKKIGRADGETLYNALIENESRIKDDSTPRFYDARNTVEFAVYHDFGGRSYILATVLDFNGQIVWVNVY